MHKFNPDSGGILQFDAKIAFNSARVDAGFTALPGEILCLAGPSGAGKSTCLSVIAGLKLPDRGKVTLGNRVLTDTQARINVALEDRRIGFLSQDYSLFPHLSALENIKLGAHRCSRVLRTEIAESWLNRLELTHCRSQRPASLSGGQQQRVALARMLASDPDILLLDEPFAAVDENTRRQLRDLIITITTERNLPTIIVTHDRNDIIECAAKMVILENGSVTDCGSVSELFHHPKTPFAAQLANSDT